MQPLMFTILNKNALTSIERLQEDYNPYQLRSGTYMPIRTIICRMSVERLLEPFLIKEVSILVRATFNTVKNTYPMKPVDLPRTNKPLSTPI